MRNSRDRLQFVQEVLTIDVVEAASCKVKTNDALHKKDIVVSPPFNPLPHCFRFRRHLSFDPAEMEAIDIVWLKKDIRLHDHGPLSLISQSQRRCIILYLYEV
jgi:hypothetical protein